jgi:DNA adenine methylase
MNQAVEPFTGPEISAAARAAQLLEINGKYRSPLRYPGGKQKAIQAISQKLPASASEYREPLVGGGAVYFHARTIRLAQRYWINDKFTELVAFWQAVQDANLCAKLMSELEELRSRFKSASRAKAFFLRARQEEAKDLYRQALLFFFFNRVTFSGTTRAGGFSSSASLRRFTASSIERLTPMPQALAGTRITNLDFQDVIAEPGNDVFIFLDPPYYTATRLYGHGGSLHEFDHERLARLLRETPHRFLITYDDCDHIRSLYAWAKIQPWQLQYGMNNCNLQRESKIGAEIFISNY